MVYNHTTLQLHVHVETVTCNGCANLHTHTHTQVDRKAEMFEMGEKVVRLIENARTHVI